MTISVPTVRTRHLEDVWLELSLAFPELTQEDVLTQKDVSELTDKFMLADEFDSLLDNLLEKIGSISYIDQLILSTTLVVEVFHENWLNYKKAVAAAIPR